MNSTMQSKALRFLLRFVLPLVFWLSIWQCSALLVNRSFFLPTVPETLSALVDILLSENFFTIVSLTLLRIFSGLILGIILGLALGISAFKSQMVYSLLSPIISVIKATPVASVIILLWISMNGNTLSVLIALLMVLPIIWQNVYDGLSSVDRELSELTYAYEFSFIKKMKILVMPALSSYLIPAVITATGLAFKSEIAAEIIAGVRDSIGQMIYHSKDVLDTAAVFAWTIVGIFFSIIFEKLTRYLLSLLVKKRKGDGV